MEAKQEFLNNVKTLSELEAWSTANNCHDDPEVNLKRIELLAKQTSLSPLIHPSVQKVHCLLCNQPFIQRKNLLRHIITVHDDKRYECGRCGKSYSRFDDLQSHSCGLSLKRPSTSASPQSKRPCLQSKENIPSPARYDACNWCGHHKCLLPGKQFCESCSHSGRECLTCHRPLPERFYSSQVQHCDSCVRRRERYETRQANQVGGGQRSALEGSLRTTTLTPSQGDSVDILQFLATEQDNIVDILQDFLEEKKGMKWFLTLKLKYVKYDENNQSHLAEPVLRSTNFWVSNLSEINEQLAEAFQKLFASSQDFQAEGSGWILDHIIHLEVNTAEYVPLSASSYIPLPKYLADKKAVLNIKNNDQKCFLWCILAALHPLSFKNNANRVSKYVNFESELNMCGIDTPVPLSQIPKFEKQNNISVNVFGYDDKEVFPLHVSKYS